jgi:hypothetical protein
MTQFTSGYIESFRFSSIYDKMNSLAPKFIRLFSRFTARPVAEASPDADVSERRKVEVKQQQTERSRQRAVVVALSILANLRNQQHNLVQGVIGYYLYASKVSKRVIGVLDHLNISVGSTSIGDALRSNKDAFIVKLKAIVAEGKAYFLSYNNLAKKVNVRDDRTINFARFFNAVSIYFFQPHRDLSQPMFSANDCNYNLVS